MFRWLSAFKGGDNRNVERAQEFFNSQQRKNRHRSCDGSSMHKQNSCLLDLAVYVWATIKYVGPYPTGIFAVWLLFCYFLGLPQPYRAVAIWTLIVSLCVGAGRTDYMRKRRKNG